MDIEYLLFLQKIREYLGDFGNDIFCFISYFGSSTLVLLIVAVIYWSINKKIGAQIALNLAVASFISQTLKNIFCVYRPWIRDSRLQPSDRAIKGALGYSFPSVHSQVAMNLYGTLAEYASKKWLKAVLIGIALLIGFSRNFLGVHTPQDVIIGLLIGFVSIFMVKKVVEWVDYSKNQSRDLVFLCIATVIVIVTVVSMNYKNYPIDYYDGNIVVDPVEKITDWFKVVGMTMGIILGWILERKYVEFSTDVDMKMRIVRSVIGLIIVLIINYTTKLLSSILDARLASFINTFSVLLFVSFVWPAIFCCLEKKFKGKKL